MKQQGFGFEIKWEEGDKIGSMPITEGAVKALKKQMGKHPEEYIKEYIGNDQLYKKIRKAYKEAEDKAIPKDLECDYCKGISTKEEDKACMRFYLQMGVTYNLAATEFVNTVERNKHLYKNKKFLRRLTACFIQCFYFYEGTGMVWFDLPKLQKMCLSEGFLSISEQFRQSDILQNLVQINDTLDHINTSLVRDELNGGHDPNLYVIQKKFFEDKMTYYEKKLKLIKEKQNTCSNTLNKSNGRPNRTDIAFYAYYLSEVKESFVKAHFPSVKAYKELGDQFSTNYKNIQVKYNAISADRSERLKPNHIKNIEYVTHEMLKDNPKAQKLALDELKIAKLNR